jgi:hypothetical protein
MVAHDLAKVETRVRFPYPAPIINYKNAQSFNLGLFFITQKFATWMTHTILQTLTLCPNLITLNNINYFPIIRP